jgi:hypothetical protein
MVDERERQEAIRSDKPMDYLFGNRGRQKSTDKPTPPLHQIEKIQLQLQ